jgi:hypothetical protein
VESTWHLRLDWRILVDVDLDRVVRADVDWLN